MKLFLHALFIALLCGHSLLWAGDTPLSFEDPVLQSQYENMLEEIRCLVCQNQSLSDSNADLAQDLRQEIHGMLDEGHSEEDVVDFLVARYGDFVLYRPPLRLDTLLLWAGPFVLLLLAAIAITIRVRSNQDENIVLDAEQRAELEELLNNSGRERQD